MQASQAAFPLLALLPSPSAAQETPRALEPLNLRIVVQRTTSGGSLTLEDGFLVASEPVSFGQSRVYAFASQLAGPRLVTIHDGLFGTPHLQLGRFLVTAGREAYAGDLNGDGDTLDYGSVVHDIQANQTLPSFAIQVGSPAVGHGLAAFTISEPADGRDWNGDGDTNDSVPAAWNLESGAFILAGSQTFSPRPCSEGLVTVASEALQQSDLTGDGDQNDSVYQVLDLVSGTMTNTGLDLADLPTAEVARFGERAFGFVADRPGGLALMAYSFDRREVQDLGVSTLFDVPFTHQAVGRWVAFGRLEVFGTDWNGDGDFDDTVLFLYDAATGSITNTLNTLGVWIDSYSLQALGSEGLGFRIDESSHDKDLNGDGDLNDSIVHILDLATGALRNTHLGGTIRDGILYADEQADGVDRNGDGDALDTIPYILGGVGGTDVSLGVASGDVRLGPEWAAVAVNEGQQGADLNGDGDLADQVLHSYERATGSLVNLGLPVLGGINMVLSGRTVGVPVREGGTVDLNNDGDQSDSVFHLVDLETGARTNLRLAASGTRPARMSDQLFAFVVNEQNQGADLDGDGRIESVGVLHVVRGPFSRRLLRR